MQHRSKIYILLAVAILMLVPNIFMPLGSDQAIFMIGGKQLLSGKTLYVDFIDIKPPIIFYISSLVNLIFGFNELAPRIFDFLIQSITVLLIFRLVSKQTGNDFTGAISSIMYAFVYGSKYYTETFQTESFTGLFIILILFLVLKDKPKAWHILAKGGLAAILVGLKLTFGVVLIAILIGDSVLWNISNKEKLKRAGLTMVGFIIVFTVVFLPLLFSDIRSGYLTMIEYMSYYANHPPLGFGFIKTTYYELGKFIGIHLFYFIFFYVLFARSDIKTSRLVNFSFLLVFLLLFSVAFEKKYFGYHYIRLFVPMAVVASVGLADFRNRLKEILNKYKWQRLTLIITIALFVILSPLLKYSRQLYDATFYFNKEKYDEHYNTEGALTYPIIQYRKVVSYMKDNADKNQKVSAIVTGGGMLNLLLLDNGFEISKFMQSCFVISEGTPEVWKQELIEEIEESDWLIFQNNDMYMFFNGHNLSGWEYMNSNERLRKAISKNFKEMSIIDNFIILKKQK